VPERIDDRHTGRIDRLSADSGVRFSACMNTMSTMTKALGHAPELNDDATQVQAGVVRIIDLVDQGYTLIKP